MFSFIDVNGMTAFFELAFTKYTLVMQLYNISSIIWPKTKVTLAFFSWFSIPNHIIRNKCNDVLLYFMIYEINVIVFKALWDIIRFEDTKGCSLVMKFPTSLKMLSQTYDL